MLCYIIGCKLMLIFKVHQNLCTYFQSMDFVSKVLALVLAFSSYTNAAISLTDSTGNVKLTGEQTANGLNIVVSKNDDTKLSSTFGVGSSFLNVDCIGQSSCTINQNINLKINPISDGFEISWVTESLTTQLEDCFDLKNGSVNWYGGPERYYQVWPLENQVIDPNLAYVSRKDDNFAKAERYWLNSKGAYIFLDEKVPLFVGQNSGKADSVCFIAKSAAPYINRSRVLLSYVIVVKDNAKEAQLHAVQNYLGKPEGHPNEKMIAEPIWTTWAKYKRDINDKTVVEFAEDIRNHGFTGGQLEIDDNWEACYGAQTFDQNKFANITNTVKTLKEKNFRVTLWIHPFVEDECIVVSKVGLEKGYFVKNTTNSTLTQWWDSSNSHQIDFTNPDAAKWFTDRLDALQKEPGIDSFKFDAGETDYVAQPAVYDHVDQELVPNVLTTSYLNTVARFGDLIEVRSAFRSQNLPIFYRMLDKDSNWGVNDGLYTLVTTLLALNMNGYGMILPDMIGGNAYSSQPTAELLVRWTEANVFMPSMQFSFLPWDFEVSDYNPLEIVRKYIDLHKQYSPDIIQAMNNSISTGEPVNPPIWWIDPTDPIALACGDEFLLGSNILVAPVLEENAIARDIYLPKGSWKDGNNGTVYTGPLSISKYPAPIDVLPYFIKTA